MSSSSPSSESTYTTFVGDLRLVTGPLTEMLRATKAHLDAKGAAGPPVLIFEDASGQQTDFDFRGTPQQVLARAAVASAPAQRSGPGRPRLGVVSREVSLLPRHWDWLEGQPGGASAALRRLIDAARKREAEAGGAGSRITRRSVEAAGRFMTAMAGDRAGYEEAARALYAQGAKPDLDALQRHIRDWPEGVQSHLLYLLEPPFQLEASAG